jgi:hypothetical protein
MEQVIEDFIREAGTDEVGLWRVAKVARYDFGKVAEVDVRATSLKVIEELLSRGVEIVDYYEGRGWVRWPGQGTKAILSRIDREWMSLGRDPNIGDICWFKLPSNG